MLRPLSVLVIAALLLGACATVRDSRINPFNWFGRAQVEASGTDNPLIPRRAFGRRPAEVYQGRTIDRITDLSVEQMPGGAIIRATGVSQRLGSYQVRLTPLPEQSDAQTLSYSLDRVLPERAPAAGAVPARTVTAAVRLTDRALEGIRTIRVLGATNAMVTRR